MRDFTQNESRAVLTILKSPETAYNANSLSKVLYITPMGTLKILKRLEREGVLTSRQIGKARVYQINTKNAYARKYVSFLLAAEAAGADPRVKRWVNEVRRLESSDLTILFGSVLRKQDPGDIDVLLVTDQKRFEKLKKEVSERNALNAKPINPLYQTFDDLVRNIRERDRVVLNAIKGIVVKGEERFMVLYDESRKE